MQDSSEVDDPTERLKRKRRESAQRSRARKNAYMKQLEVRFPRVVAAHSAAVGIVSWCTSFCGIMPHLLDLLERDLQKGLSVLPEAASISRAVETPDGLSRHCFCSRSVF